MLQTVQRHGVCSAAYGIVHYHSISVMPTTSFLLSRYCPDCAESDVDEHYLTHCYMTYMRDSIISGTSDDIFLEI